MNSEPAAQYIYGVIPAPVPEVIGRNGLTIVAYEDIAAVTGQSQPVDITKMRKDALARLLVGHQKVIESVMQSVTTVVPFRLGTYAGSENEIKEILAKGQKLIRRIFTEINGKIEMDVAATWADFAAVLKEIGAEDEIRKLKQSFAGNPRGVGVDDQMQIGLMIKKTLDHKRLTICRQIAGQLASAACAQRAHENMDDQMVMNGAFLIETERRSEFERILDELNGRFAEKLNFRCVGPLPPYSFYTLELKKIGWEDVDWARHIMNLSAAASAADIKKAFQQAVRATHPDHCAQPVEIARQRASCMDSRGAYVGRPLAADDLRTKAEEAERSFNELNSARQIIMEYTQACEQTGPADQFVFSAESVRQNSLLVKVRNGKEHG